jgi:hypothetical protein
MTRAVIESVLLFLVPFGLFFVWLAFRQRSPGQREAWSPAVTWLTVAGLLLAIGGVLFGYATSERRIGGYEPAHVENGVLVPGRVR